MITSVSEFNNWRADLANKPPRERFLNKRKIGAYVVGAAAIFGTLCMMGETADAGATYLAKTVQVETPPPAPGDGTRTIGVTVEPYQQAGEELDALERGIALSLEGAVIALSTIVVAARSDRELRKFN